MKVYELIVYKKETTLRYKGTYYSCLWLLDKYSEEKTELIETEVNQ